MTFSGAPSPMSSDFSHGTNPTTNPIIYNDVINTKFSQKSKQNYDNFGTIMCCRIMTISDSHRNVLQI